MIIICLGMILSVLGMMIASGLDQGGLSYSAFQGTFIGLNLFFILGITVLFPDIFETEEDQSPVEQDMSIV